MKKIKEVALAMLGSIALAGTAQADKLELFVNNENTMLDVASYTQVHDDVHFFLRDRLKMDYSGNHNNFLLTEVGYALPKGVALIAQPRAFNGSLSGWGGVSYTNFNAEKDMFVTTSLATGGNSKDLTQEVNLILDKKFGNNVRFEFQNLTWLNDGNITGAFRPKVGYQFKDNFVVGVGGELDYSSKPKGRAGVYFQVRK